MKKTHDIKLLLSKELNASHIRETGYDCDEGNRYVEIRNVVFEVDKPYIFESDREKMDDSWYIENYEPRIIPQLENLVDRIVENPFTRQAVLVLAGQNELETPGFICTIYTHIFLDKINENEYDIEYSVHMRSNNVIDFNTDIRWNEKIFGIIIKKIEERTNWKLNKKNIVWFADSIHIYEKNWNLLNYGKN